MKLNRRRIDARIPNWLYSELMDMAEKRGWSFTEILEATAEKGLNWYKKNWEKTKNPEQPKEEAGPDERRSNAHQQNNKLEEMRDKLESCQEYNEYLKKKHATHGSFWFEMFLVEITGEPWHQETDRDGSKIMSKALEILDQKHRDTSESTR